MLNSPKAGSTVWFLHGDKVTCGTVISEKTIDGFYSVAVSVGIPKLLKPDELYESESDVRQQPLQSKIIPKIDSPGNWKNEETTIGRGVRYPF